MSVRYPGQHVKYRRPNKERHGNGAHKSNPYWSSNGRYARNARVHSVRYLYVHRATKEADISLWLGSVRTVPHALHAVAAHHQHRHHAHASRLEVHRY